MRYSSLSTDLYELTMLAGYVENQLQDKPAVFDLFFRTNPFEGSYAVFAGLETALDFLEQVRFSEDELTYLAGLGLFKPHFIEYLRTFRFCGAVIAPPEGTLVFAHEPLLTVTGTLAEAQFVETALLNIINYQTLVATKAARICRSADNAEVIEFGLRRAQGPNGGLSAARAATIGGCTGTSNVLAGMQFGLPVRGTQAHSWIQAFPDELSAFRAYADLFPQSTILLVDTYDTLKSGVPHAITVARELREQGLELLGIRIDSGDLAYLSREARRMLDSAGFHAVNIIVSNDMDEFAIEALNRKGGQVTIYGIGTNLVTGAGAGGGALGGVYKLVEMDGAPKLKITGDSAKSTLPGNKRVLRALDPEGMFLQDLICLADEEIRAGDAVYDLEDTRYSGTLPADATVTELRATVMSGGRRVLPAEPLSAMAERCRTEFGRLPAACRPLIPSQPYKVSLSEQLASLRRETHEKLGRRWA